MLNICNDIIYSDKNNIDIGSFIYLFRLKHPEFGINLQNDTQEFFRVLLQDINLELNENKRKNNYQQIYYNDHL